MALPEGSLAPRDLEDYRPIHTGPGFLRPLDCPGRRTKRGQRRQLSAPVLRAMPDVQDFDNFLGVPVHNDVWRTDEFAGSLHLSRSANAGERRQFFDAVDNRLSNIPCGDGAVLLDPLNSGLKLVGRFCRPPNQPHERNSLSIRFRTS